MAASFLLSFTINFLAGTALRRSSLDRPQFRQLWQTWEVWQLVCYLHLLGSPISGNALLLIRPMMMLVNFDFVNASSTLRYYAGSFFTKTGEPQAALGPNFVALNLDSFYFMKNSASMVAVFLPVFTVMFLLNISSIAIRSLRQKCDQDDWYAFLKTVLQM